MGHVEREPAGSSVSDLQKINKELEKLQVSDDESVFSDSPGSTAPDSCFGAKTRDFQFSDEQQVTQRQQSGYRDARSHSPAVSLNSSAPSPSTNHRVKVSPHWLYRKMANKMKLKCPRHGTIQMVNQSWVSFNCQSWYRPEPATRGRSKWFGIASGELSCPVLLFHTFPDFLSLTPLSQCHTEWREDPAVLRTEGSHPCSGMQFIRLLITCLSLFVYLYTRLNSFHLQLPLHRTRFYILAEISLGRPNV